MQSINPELQLDRTEQAYLAAITSQPGFTVLQKIMQAEADKFIVAMINADPSDREGVLTKHLLAKSAAQFCQALVNRIYTEVTDYSATPRDGDEPVNAAEGLDLGDIQAHLKDVPNFFGGEELE